MAETRRRAGCGCLSLLFLVFGVASLLMLALARGEGDELGGVLAAGAGAVVLAGLVAALVVRARRDRLEDEAPSAGGGAPPTRPSRPAPPPAGGRTEREVRSGARRLTTEPDTDEARVLKQRLTEAVADLADTVEDMPEGSPARPLTSEEMIVRAKRRIRRQGEGPET